MNTSSKTSKKDFLGRLHQLRDLFKHFGSSFRKDQSGELINNMSLGYARFTLKGDILDYNNAFRKMMHLQESKINDINFFNLWKTPSERASFSKEIQHKNLVIKDITLEAQDGLIFFVTIYANIFENSIVAVFTQHLDDPQNASHDDFLLAFRNNSYASLIFEFTDAGNPDFILKEINKSGEELTGLKKSNSEILRLSKLKGIYKTWYDHFITVILTGSTENFEAYNNVSDTWLEVSVFRTKSNQCVAVIKDITNQKLKENALKHEAEQLSTAMESGTVDWWVFDIDTQKLTYSHHMARMLGYKPEEMPDSLDGMMQLIHPDDVSMVQNKLSDCLDNKIPEFETEIRIRKKDHTYMWSLTKGRIAKHFKENSRLMIGTSINITQLKKTRIDLNRSHNLFQKVAENYPHSIVTIINKDLTVSMISGKEFKRLNLNQKDFIGVSIKKIDSVHYHILKEKFTKTFNGEIQSFVLKYKINFYNNYTIPIVEDNTIEQILVVTENITQQKQSEIDLKKSEEKYRLIADNTVDVIWKMDLRLNFTYVSPSIKRMAGFNQEEWIGTNLKEHTSRKEFLKMIRNTITNLNKSLEDNPIIMEACMLHKDGTEIPVEITGKILLDQNGRPSSFQGSTRDISERKKARQALDEIHLLNSSIIKNLPGGLIYFGKDYRYKIWNPYMEKISGIKSEDILGKHPYEVFPNLKELNFVETLTSSINRAKSFSKVAPYYFNKDKNGWLHYLINPVKNTDNEFETLLFVRDITEEKNTQDALNEHQNKLQAAIENMTDAFFVMDNDGNLIEFNEAFALFHKFKNKDECYHALSQYQEIINVCEIDGTILPLDMWAVPRALRGEKVMNSEYLLERKDTGEKWFGRYNFSPIRNEEGKITGAVVVGHDITEEKRVFEELVTYKNQLEKLIAKRTAELEKKNQELLNKNQELEHLNDLFVNREFRIQELKDRIAELEKTK